MNLKKISLIFFAIVSIFFGSFIEVHADLLEMDAITLSTEEKDLVSDALVFEELTNEIQVILPQKIRTYQSVEAEIWSKSDRSDLQRFQFEVNDKGEYQLRLGKGLAGESRALYATITAQDDQGRLFQVQDVPIKWENSQQPSTTISSKEDSSTISQTSQSSSQVKEATATEALSKVTLSIENHNFQKGTFDVLVSNTSHLGAIRKIKIPVWTREKGQDDLRWYEGKRQPDGTYKITVDKKNHKNEDGIYNVHLYYENMSGQSIGLAATTTFLYVKGQIKVANSDTAAGTFDIVISAVESPTSPQKVRVPIWTKEGGQDDIRWYDAVRQPNGEYKVHVDKKNHKNGTGTYHVHLYYQFAKNYQIGIAATDFSFLHKAAGKLVFQNTNARSGTFEILVTGVTSTSRIKTVYIPVWTDKNGQDDIRWYTATKQPDGAYKLVVNKKDHKGETGIYHTHLYYVYENGKRDGIAATKTTLPEASAVSADIKVQYTDAATGQFDVILSNISSPTALSAILVPIWSDKNGQDDIRWYEAVKQSDGTYKVSVAPSQHKYDKGDYHIHLYFKDTKGKLTGVKQTKTRVNWTKATPHATVSIENVNQTIGTFDVVVSNLYTPYGVEKIQVPVWSDKDGQDDIIWYDALKQQDGTYRVTVRAASHKYDSGLYHAHVYLTSKGTRHGIGATSTTIVLAKKTVRSFIDVSSHNGSLSVADYQHLKNQGITGVVVKLTEGTSYKNPYAEGQIRNAQKVGIKVSVYHYSHFTTEKEAQAEARYFVAFAKTLGLSTNTVMVNDIEEYKTRTNINKNMKAWESEMRRLGYSNLVHYTGASWLDVNSLGYKGPIQANLFGLQNFWVAHYPYVNGMSLAQAQTMSYHNQTGAWQFTSKATLLPGRSFFDLNIDYTGRFTN